MAWVEAVAKNKANQVQETNRQRMAWVEEKNKAAWCEKNPPYHWPLLEEHGKRVIHGAPHIWNDNTCSWTRTNMIYNAAAAAIASAVSDAPS